MRVSKRIQITFLLVFLFASNCNKKKSEIDPDKDALMIEGRVLTTGGAVDLSEVATVFFEANTFSQETLVHVLKSEKDETVIDFYKNNAEFFGVDSFIGYFIKVRLEGNNPKLPIKVSIVLPNEFYQNIKKDYAFEVLALSNQSVDDETILGFDVIESKLDAKEHKLEVTVPVHYFDIKESGRYFEAVFTVATLPGVNKSLKVTANDDCGFYIRCPLQTCTVTSPYNPNREHPTLRNPDGTKVIRPHRGVDYRAPKNTSVFAAYDGLVIRSGTLSGYGNVVDIEHKNTIGQRFATRYAHLTKSMVSKDQKVNEGDLIALSGNTGIGDAPHLHFEYFANANVNSKNDNVDPVQFVNTANIRLISAQAKLTGINSCTNGTRSPWQVNFKYNDPSKKITSNAVLTFQDIEPIVNPPYTVPIGNLIAQDGLVSSTVFCARFDDVSYFKVKVFMTLEDGSRSNCIYFILNREAGAHRLGGQDGNSIARPSTSIQ